MVPHEPLLLSVGEPMVPPRAPLLLGSARVDVAWPPGRQSRPPAATDRAQHGRFERLGPRQPDTARVDAGRRCLAEAIGTFVLVLATVGATVVSGSLVGVAVATGLALAAAITALGPVSGAHFNPAVTVAFLARRLISRQLAALYVVAQLAGAVIAMIVVDVAYPARHRGGRHQARGRHLSIRGLPARGRADVRPRRS